MTEGYTGVETDESHPLVATGMGRVIWPPILLFQRPVSSTKTLIMAISTGKGMGSSFDGTPVITSGNQNGINTVKNPFIVVVAL